MRLKVNLFRFIDIGHNCFNSTIVRLKGEGRDACLQSFFMFQFYDSAIKRQSLKLLFLLIIFGFNSMIVRLKGSFLMPNDVLLGFQFYDSPIKSLAEANGDGSIAGFNFMIVRLKASQKRTATGQ